MLCVCVCVCVCMCVLHSWRSPSYPPPLPPPFWIQTLPSLSPAAAFGNIVKSSEQGFPVKKYWVRRRRCVTGEPNPPCKNIHRKYKKWAPIQKKPPKHITVLLLVFLMLRLFFVCFASLATLAPASRGTMMNKCACPVRWPKRLRWQLPRDLTCCVNFFVRFQITFCGLIGAFKKLLCTFTICPVLRRTVHFVNYRLNTPFPKNSGTSVKVSRPVRKEEFQNCSS